LGGTAQGLFPTLVPDSAVGPGCIIITDGKQGEDIIILSLSDFEEYIDNVILKRGYDYFVDGRVSWLEATEHGIEAGVEGREDYTVSLTLDPGGHITYTYCSCPYDGGPFCKHKVAVFYALRKLNSTGELITEQEGPKNLQDRLSALLERLNPDEMRAIILNIGKQHPEIAKALLAQYAAPGEEITACQRLIQEYIRKAKRNDIIHTAYAVTGIVMTLEKAEDRLDEDDYTTAIGLILAALPQAVDMLNYCDDSDGDVSQVIYDSLEILEQAVVLVAKHPGVAEQKGIMASIIKEALDKRYDGWEDWRYDLLKVCVHFAAIPELRQELEKVLATLQEGLDERDRYGQTRLKNIQLDIIESFDDSQRVEEFIFTNVSNSEFRKKAIQIAVQKQDYHKVIQLALEGEQTDSAHAGLVHEWREYRYLAYEKLGDVDMQRQLAMHLIYERDFEYFGKLKALFPSRQWPGVVDEILKEFEKRNYLPEIYVNILIEEKLWERLLRYCQRYPFEFLKLYKYLLDDYPDEVSLLFREHIENQAQLADQRSKYQQICSLIREYRKACGTADADRIIAELKRTYARRPAFMDELGKL
jgi:hypothetical protein